jgi:isoleucyl-tRNA synthetase
MTAQLDATTSRACDTTRSFLDVLTNWYIRRSRDRFWDTDNGDWMPRRGGLRHALHGARGRMPRGRPAAAADDRGGLARPHRRRSVHLTDWPDAEDPARRSRARRGDGPVREVCSVGPSLRKAAGCATACRWRADGRRHRSADALRALLGDRRRRGQRQGGRARDAEQATRRTSASRSAHGQRPRGRPAPGQGRADRDQGLEVRRLVGRGRRHGVCAAYRWSRASSPRDDRRRRLGRHPGDGDAPGGGFVVLDTDVDVDLELEGAARDLIREAAAAMRPRIRDGAIRPARGPGA